MPDAPGAAPPELASPFVRLRALLDHETPEQTPVSMALGEPQHAPPEFVLDALADAAADYDKYPPIAGTESWQAAARGWLQRRFSLDAALPVLPLNGTREGLFLAAQLAPPKADGRMAMPNPFYQVYAAAARAAGATPIYLNAAAETGFLPDLAAIDWSRLRALYLCTPANPQGAIADRAYLADAVQRARQHNVLLLVDECYAEIYDAAAPASVMQVITPDALEDAPVLVFHSLSKRSNLPGLRSGLVTGGRAVMQRFADLRQIAGPQSPLPVQAAAALAWADDVHVEANRVAYRSKLDIAEQVFGDSYGFYRPAGGFFLWLKVGDGEAAARHVWQTQGLRVLPGAYLTQPTGGENIGHDYLRVALVAPQAETEAALLRLKTGLDDFAAGRAKVPA